MNSLNLLNQASPKELGQGFVYQETTRSFQCLFCEKKYQKGRIYTVESSLVDAEFAIHSHIVDQHHSVFKALLDLEKPSCGLSAIQKEIISLLYQGLSDAQIAHQLGNKAKSTIRNHRFQLREKYKEAGIFMVIMEKLFEKQNRPEEEFVQFHSSLTVSDDRVKITEIEKTEILEKYFEDGKLISFPKKQKRKLILLQYIASMFEARRRYTEKEVNEILSAIFDDYVTIRRYLIEYGFMDRLRDGAEYWMLN